jgi:hypothetical protein
MARERAGLGPGGIRPHRCRHQPPAVRADHAYRWAPDRQPATAESTRIRTIAIDSQVASFKVMRRHILGAELAGLWGS